MLVMNRTSTSEAISFVLRKRKVFSLRYHREGKGRYAEVGKIHYLDIGPVIAIVYEDNRRVYHVCTQNRGVERGIPILIGLDEVEEVTDFEKE